MKIDNAESETKRNHLITVIHEMGMISRLFRKERNVWREFAKTLQRNRPLSEEKEKIKELQALYAEMESGGIAELDLAYQPDKPYTIEQAPRTIRLAIAAKELAALHFCQSREPWLEKSLALATQHKVVENEWGVFDGFVSSLAFEAQVIRQDIWAKALLLGRSPKVGNTGVTVDQNVTDGGLLEPRELYQIIKESRDGSILRSLDLPRLATAIASDPDPDKWSDELLRSMSDRRTIVAAAIDAALNLLRVEDIADIGYDYSGTILRRDFWNELNLEKTIEPSDYRITRLLQLAEEFFESVEGPYWPHPSEHALNLAWCHAYVGDRTAGKRWRDKALSLSRGTLVVIDMSSGNRSPGWESHPIEKRLIALDERIASIGPVSGEDS